MQTSSWHCTLRHSPQSVVPHSRVVNGCLQLAASNIRPGRRRIAVVTRSSEPPQGDVSPAEGPNPSPSSTGTSPSPTSSASDDASPRSPSPSPSDHLNVSSHEDPAAAHLEWAATAPASEAPRTPTPTDLVSHPLQDQEDFFAAEELLDELKGPGVGSRGEGWALAVTAALALLITCPFRLQGLVDLIGTLCLTAGLVFIAYGLLSLGKSFSPLPVPRARHNLITGGMYTYVRHPMYGGMLLGALGLACLTRSETRLALALLLAWVLDRLTALEERRLEDRYPGQYPAYCTATKHKFIPFLV